MRPKVVPGYRTLFPWSSEFATIDEREQQLSRLRFANKATLSSRPQAILELDQACMIYRRAAWIKLTQASVFRFLNGFPKQKWSTTEILEPLV